MGGPVLPNSFSLLPMKNLGILTFASLSPVTPTYAIDYNYNYPQANSQFHPKYSDYYNGNKRLIF